MEPHEQSTELPLPFAAGESESAATPSVAQPEAVQAEQAEAHAPAEAEPAKVENPALEKKRIEEQLEALKRRESELRRALATASHPELADAIRLIEGKAYGLSRVELKMAEGLSKSEERRKQTVEKKRAGLLEKRAELDAQIAELDSELAALGIERTQAFELERRGAMEQLVAALGAHGAELSAAGLEASQLVPDIARWLPEIQQLAEELAGAKKSVN